MNIKESHDFSVVKTEQASGESPRITLIHSQQGKEFSSVGAVLEAQYTVGDKHLLFITEGTPYEEALHIVLLDSSLQVQDSLELSADYSSGMLRNLSVHQSDEIRFSFFDDEETWLVKVSQKPHRQLWGNRHPVKRKSPFLGKKWIELQKS